MIRVEKLFLSAILSGAVMAFVPAVSFAETCTAGDQLTYQECIATANTTCLTSVPHCSGSTNTTVASTGDLVSAAVDKCCKIKKTKGQKSCLTAQKTKVQLSLLGLPSGLTPVRTLLRKSVNEFRDLLKTADPCSTVSVD